MTPYADYCDAAVVSSREECEEALNDYLESGAAPAPSRSEFVSYLDSLGIADLRASGGGAPAGAGAAAGPSATIQAQAPEPAARIATSSYLDAITEVCNPDKDLGEWITFLDITQADAGAPLRLEDQEYLGECRRECRTIQKACRAVYDEHREDVAESLFKRDAASVEKFANRLCNKWGGVCPYKPAKSKTPYVHPDEYWMPVDEEMYKMHNGADAARD